MAEQTSTIWAQLPEGRSFLVLSFGDALQGMDPHFQAQLLRSVANIISDTLRPQGIFATAAGLPVYNPETRTAEIMITADQLTGPQAETMTRLSAGGAPQAQDPGNIADVLRRLQPLIDATAGALPDNGSGPGSISEPAPPNPPVPNS